MDLEGLLNASLELEKRKATDQLLRKYFSSLWKNDGPKRPAPTSLKPGPSSHPGLCEVSVQFPPEMCELLEIAAKATGKTPSKILEESFVEFYLNKVNPRLEK